MINKKFTLALSEIYSTRMHFKNLNYTIAVLIISTLFFACNNDVDKNNSTASDSTAKQQANTAPKAPNFNSENLEVKTYEVKDSTSGKSFGWGYDLYVDGHLAIHQPILPGVAGNSSFSSEAQAKMIGTFALNKMKNTGSLPTISIQELDSLGINIVKK